MALWKMKIRGPVCIAMIGNFAEFFFETATRPFGHHGHVCLGNRTKRQPRELRVSAALTAFQFLGLRNEILTDSALYVSQTFADG